tara:strand:+ start:511 stop:924 length:414 start_codon:yes stop_codon:yes gene_type:complete
MIDFKGLNMLEILLAALIGVVVGAGGATIAHSVSKDKTPEPIIINSHEGTEEAIKQLTNLDLAAPLCSSEFIDKNSDRLCREVLCLQFSRGLDSKTAGSQCESISNINNKIEIEKWCNQYQDQSLKQDCVDLFWKRN